MDPVDYLNKLYPLQDRALRSIAGVGTAFYLTGGTALSRAYLRHRFSDDLDLFVNDDDRFPLWSAQVVHALDGAALGTVQVLQREARFVRLLLDSEAISLRIEMVNVFRLEWARLE